MPPGPAGPSLLRWARAGGEGEALLLRSWSWSKHLRHFSRSWAHSQPFHPSTKIFISNSSHVLCRVTVSFQMASRPGQRRTCSSSSSEFTASFKQKTVGLIARATAIYLNPAQYSMPDGALHAGYWRRTAVVLASASSVACSTREKGIQFAEPNAGTCIAFFFFLFLSMPRRGLS